MAQMSPVAPEEKLAALSGIGIKVDHEDRLPDRANRLPQVARPIMREVTERFYRQKIIVEEEQLLGLWYTATKAEWITVLFPFSSTQMCRS
ncbi:hypothetical protein MMC15_006038 [Xylographa vitiligo]|nr:hypothetical protein [Xylographa vitiligo]